MGPASEATTGGKVVIDMDGAAGNDIPSAVSSRKMGEKIPYFYD